MFSWFLHAFCSVHLFFFENANLFDSAELLHLCAHVLLLLYFFFDPSFCVSAIIILIL